MVEIKNFLLLKIFKINIQKFRIKKVLKKLYKLISL